MRRPRRRFLWLRRTSMSNSNAALWCLLCLIAGLAVLLVRQRRSVVALRREVEACRGSVRSRDEELVHLAEVRLPATLESSGQVVVPGLRNAHLTSTPFARGLSQVLEVCSQAVDASGVRAEQAARSVLVSTARAAQSLAAEQQVLIRDMQGLPDLDGDAVEQLMRVDHAGGQIIRRTRVLLALCGSWPGRQRDASTLTDVVRGATGLIRDYRRVRLPARVDVAVVSRAVEPLVLAVAELLDNATRHSDPTMPVEAGIRVVHTGAAIVIEDAGVGMDEQQVQEISDLLSGRRPVRVTGLGDPPRIGLAAVAALSTRYGFEVSVDAGSPFGGVRAVVHLPRELLTHVDAGDAGPAAETVALRAALPAPDGPDGLPQRRRRRPVAPDAAAEAPHAAPRDASAAAGVMGAWARGTRRGRSTTDSDSSSEGMTR
ncbi:ATP-binding protein [Peterkaempfera bronchialis]|uniref:ATP-binding protein n=1 Tax=Peterkaempfera bronchialis TaxID=2126346 RepID=UPI003C3021E4